MISKSYSFLRASIAMLAIAGIAQAQTDVTFDNAGGGDWNTPGNWSTSLVPEALFNEIAIVNNDTTITLADILDNNPPVTENGRQGPGGFTMGGGATRVEILDGALLTVTAGTMSGGATAINGGTLNLQGNGHLVTDSFGVGGGGALEYNVTGSSNFNAAPISTVGPAALNGQLAIDFGAGTGVGRRRNARSD